MTGRGTEGEHERARREAADWFARLRADRGRAAQSAFEDWRAADPVNAAAYDRLAERWEQAALLRHTEAGRARRLPARRPWIAFAPARPAFASLVAGIALLLAAGLLVLRPEATSAAAHATRVGEIRTVRLPDGTAVTLDAASRIALAYTVGERRVQLVRGRARFDVARVANRPFTVATSAGAVIARGTVFDVSLRRGRMDVTLLHGAVEVRADPATELRGFVARLRPGEKLAVGAAVKRAAEPQPALPAQARWVSGLLAYDRTPLEEVLADASRHTRRKILLADPSLGQLRVTGAFRPSPADGLAASLAAAFGLAVDVTADGAIMIGPPIPKTE